jgi:hypothetical protein
MVKDITTAAKRANTRLNTTFFTSKFLPDIFGKRFPMYCTARQTFGQ